MLDERINRRSILANALGIKTSGFAILKVFLGSHCQGPAGKDAVSLDQIKEAAAEAVIAVLRSELSQQIVAGQIAAIRQELNVIDKLADTRPSLRPIYSDMTNRIRNLTR